MTKQELSTITKSLKQPYNKFEGESAMIETIQAVLKALQSLDPKLDQTNLLSMIK